MIYVFVNKIGRIMAQQRSALTPNIIFSWNECGLVHGNEKTVEEKCYGIITSRIHH